MTGTRLLVAVAGGSARRPRLVIAVVLAIALGCAIYALRLTPTAATDTLISRSSPAYKATQRFYQGFGGEAIEVLVSGNLSQLVLSSDIDQLLGLEGCLSGNVPKSEIAKLGGENEPCGKLAASRPVKVVFGPATFINEAANQIDGELSSQSKQAETQAKQAQQVVYNAALTRHLSVEEARKLGQNASKITLARFGEGLATLALRYGLTSQPSLSDPQFVSKLVFGSNPTGTPKQRFAYLFPNQQSALISVRLKPGLSQTQAAQTIKLVRQAVAMPQWRLKHGESYLITGEPVIVADLTSSITSGIKLLAVAILLVMAVSLLLIFWGRPRLLPLAIALLAAALTFGALAISGGTLTMASIAVLPVLIGLSVDYAIQFQSRVHEAQTEGVKGVQAVRHAAAVGGSTIATAAAATVGGLLVLMLSPVPMVRGFGLLLVVGLLIAFLCTLTVGSATLALLDGQSVQPGTSPLRRGPLSRGLTSHSMSSVGHRLILAWRGARELLFDNRVNRFFSRFALIDALRYPGRILGVGLVLAALGWGLDTQTRVETDVTKLVPQQLASLRNLNTLERTTGVGGEIDLMVSAKDITNPATIKWMSSYQSNVLKRFGYTSTRGCGHAQLCPAFSLPDLLEGQAAGKSKLTQNEVRAELGAIPPYFSQDVVTPDRRLATLAFGIRLMSLDSQQQVIQAMRRELHPPPGVSAQLVGLPVLAAQANAQVVSPLRRMLTLLAGLAAVALILLVAFRGDRRRALVPLVPIVLATGWSALIVFVIRVPLNPMSVTLGALVIAVSTEFSVLLAERFRQERLAGANIDLALQRSYHHTGAAVMASGVTAIAGFGVLMLSDIQMLRGFGVVTLIDLAVSLLGVIVVLPSALLLAERGQLTNPRSLLTWLAAAAARARPLRRTRHEPV